MPWFPIPTASWWPEQRLFIVANIGLRGIHYPLALNSLLCWPEAVIYLDLRMSILTQNMTTRSRSKPSWSSFVLCLFHLHPPSFQAHSTIFIPQNFPEILSGSPQDFLSISPALQSLAQPTPSHPPSLAQGSSKESFLTLSYPKSRPSTLLKGTQPTKLSLSQHYYPIFCLSWSPTRLYRPWDQDYVYVIHHCIPST